MAGPQRREKQDGGAKKLPHTPRLSIWFFVGALCLMYGLVLLPLGIYQFSHPSETELRLPLLLKLHTTFWWGLLLTVFGGFYAVRFRPGSA